MDWNKATMAMELPAKELVQFIEPCSVSIIYTNRKTPIIQTALPRTSWLNHQCDYDYSNTYLTTCKGGGSPLQALDLIHAFIKTTPPWFRLLIGARKKNNLHFEYEVLKKFVHIIHESNNEVVFEIRHKNLNYTFSLLRSQFRRTGVLKNFSLSTTATFHNTFGRFYFLTIKPLYEYALAKTLKQLVPFMEA